MIMSLLHLGLRSLTTIASLTWKYRCFAYYLWSVYLFFNKKVSRHILIWWLTGTMKLEVCMKSLNLTQVLT